MMSESDAVTPIPEVIHRRLMRTYLKLRDLYPEISITTFISRPTGSTIQLQVFGDHDLQSLIAILLDLERKKISEKIDVGPV